MDKIIRMLIFCLEYMLRYMVVPGRVEGNCVIVDLKGLSAGNVPVSALQQVYSVMSHHYMGRVYKFYICNLSMMLGAVAGVCKSMLTDRQRQKLVFVTNTSELQKDFALHQLEVRRKHVVDRLSDPQSPDRYVERECQSPGRVSVCSVTRTWSPECWSARPRLNM